MNNRVKDIIIWDILFDSKQTIGIEIEMEGQNLSFNNSMYWKYTHDGSLRGTPESIEYLLKAPIPKREVSRVLKLLKDLMLIKRKPPARFTPSDRCGVHIHINIQYFTEENLIKFMCTYLAVENLLLRYCGEARQGNLFCLRAIDANTLISKLIEYRQDGDLLKLTSRALDIKYAAMNLGAIREHGSLEFRALKTPNDIEKINEWVKLLCCVRDQSITFSSLEDIVETVSRYGADQFVRMIFQRHTNTLINVIGPDVEDDILEGIRIIQDIAYAKPLQQNKQEGINLPDEDAYRG
jgi:hypothetical protein